MNATLCHLSTALVLATSCAASAHAEYRCNPAPTWVDREACEAAAQSPDALRRFVQNMNSIRINIQFSDYVDSKTALTWEAQDRLAAQKSTIEDAPKLASSEPN